MLNLAFHALHLAVIGLNMLGWTIPKLRIPALVCQVITAGCWVGFGLVKGWWGFCPLTYWHWQVLKDMGRTNLPTNYITYIFEDWAGLHLSHDFASGLVAGCFGMAILINLYLLRRKRG